MQAGEKRKYYWKADAPVDFNIHYHHEAEVFYPVKRDAMRGASRDFGRAVKLERVRRPRARMVRQRRAPLARFL